MAESANSEQRSIRAIVDDNDPSHPLVVHKIANFLHNAGRERYAQYLEAAADEIERHRKNAEPPTESAIYEQVGEYARRSKQLGMAWDRRKPDERDARSLMQSLSYIETALHFAATNRWDEFLETPLGQIMFEKAPS